DIRLVRNDSAGVKAALARKNVDPTEIDRLAQLDEALRRVTGERDQLRARVKELSRDVGSARRSGDAARADTLAAESRALGDNEKLLEEQATGLEREVRDLLLRIPNLPAAEVPDGDGPDDNPVVGPGGPDPASYGDPQRV